MAHQPEYGHDMALDVSGCPSQESVFEIGALFVERSLREVVESSEGVRTAELGMRLIELGQRVGEKCMFRNVPTSVVEGRPQLLAAPFESKQILPYHHDLWRVLCTTESSEIQQAHDWLIDLRTGHCLLTATFTNQDGEGLSDMSGPRLDLFPGETKLTEGESYLSGLKQIDVSTLQEQDDFEGFIRDTTDFVGGKASVVDMTNIELFRHSFINAAQLIV